MNEKAKTTMSVSEMQRMLGLCKTESYWLVHRGYFDTIYVAGKIRVVIESFEKWYANQIKWHKVDGDPPGQELRSYSYSIREMAELLSVDESVANAELFQNAFYSGKVTATEVEEAEPEEPVAEAAVPAGVDPELLMKLLANPEMAALLKTLAQTIK